MERPWDSRKARQRNNPTVVFPNRYGVIFLVVLAAMLIGSINYNNNLGFLLTFLLGAMVAVSMVHSWKNIASIRICDVRADPVFAGEPALFRCRIRADRSGAAAVNPSFHGHAAEPVEVPPDDRLTMHIPVPTARRGLLAFDRLTVSSVYPLGLFRARRLIPVDARCLVYPQPIAGEIAGSGQAAAEGISGKKGAAGVDDFQGLKPYQPGDRPQHISWKAFSRGQGLFTKQFSESAGRSAVFDWASVPGAEPEHRLSRLCYMVLWAHRRQMTYGLKLPGQSIRIGKGDAHRHNCLKALAMFGADDGP